MTAPRRAEHGFSLLEVVVVLVILSLVSVLLAGGFGRVLEVRTRLADLLDRSTERAFVGDWLRHSVNGLMPQDAPPPDGDDLRFRGDAHLFAGVSRMSLEGIVGEPIRCRWEIVADPQRGRMRLRYVTDGGRPLDVASWAGSSGRFLYYGADGVWRDSWPQLGGGQLPLLVRADIGDADAPRSIVAAPRGLRDPLPPVPQGVLGQ